MSKKRKFFNDMQDAEEEMKQSYKKKKAKLQHNVEEIDELDYTSYRFLKDLDHE